MPTRMGSSKLHALLLAGATGVGLLADQSQGQPGGAAYPGASETEMTVVREFAGIRHFTRPSRDAVMGFSLPTQVVEVVAKGGQGVKKGEVLVRGDDREDQALLRTQKLRAETDLPLKAARAQLDLATLEFDRTQDSFNRGGATQTELDRARLTLDTRTYELQNAQLNQTQEQIQVERLEARISRSRLEAPFDGQVDAIMVDSGQIVGENEKVLRVVNVDTLWIDAPAPMGDIATLRLKAGDNAWVLTQMGQEFRIAEGKVSEVSPVADFGSRTRRVRVEFANYQGEGRIVAGEPAWVRFSAPPEALTKRLAAGVGAAGAVAGVQGAR